LKVGAAQVDEGLLPGDEIVLFGDGSKSDDASGVVACRMSDGLVQVLHVQQPKKGRSSTGTVSTVRWWTRWTRTTCVAFWFDPSHAKDEDAEGDERFWWPLCDEWMRRYGPRLKFWSVKSGDGKHAVAWDMSTPSRQAQFVPAVEQLEGDLDSGDFRFVRSFWLAAHEEREASSGQVRGVDAQGAPRVGAEDRPRGVRAGARMLRRMVHLSLVGTKERYGRGFLH
jgi:hypothetical protein